MLHGLTFSVSWFDVDVIQLDVSCSNGRFSGQTSIYEVHNFAEELARALKGFPKSDSDVVEAQLGTFNPQQAGGGLQMKFQCRDAMGHCEVVVTIRSPDCLAPGSAESTVLLLPVEPAAIDQFILELDRLEPPLEDSSATLIMSR